MTVLESSRPKARYPVGFVSRQTDGARRVLPTAVWDAAAAPAVPDTVTRAGRPVRPAGPAYGRR